MEMGFSYLNNKNWRDYSREERLYCAHLYQIVENNPKKFIDLTCRKLNIQSMDDSENLEIGFEVCFYRDCCYAMGIDLKDKLTGKLTYSPKRTFDLCLFSNNRIVIYEAKVHQSFSDNQIGIFKNDVKKIKELIGNQLDVRLIAICSSSYKSALLDNFHAKITWDEIYGEYGHEIFHQADGVRKMKKGWAITHN
jgi:hypothetical protein